MGKRVGRCAGRTGNSRGHSQKFDGRSRNFRGGREYGFKQEYFFRQEYRRTLDRSTGELLTGVQEDF